MQWGLVDIMFLWEAGLTIVWVLKVFMGMTTSRQTSMYLVVVGMGMSGVIGGFMSRCVRYRLFMMV